MESLERLREFVSKGSRTQITTLPPIDMVTLDWRDLTKLIDEIEEEFKGQELAHAFANSQVYEFANSLKGQLLDFDKMDEQQDAMAANGWVKLPKDADGEPIHVGDKVVEVDEPAVPRTVTRINLAGDGWLVCINGIGRRSDKYRHHHAPTVEGVLDEMLQRFSEDGYEGGMSDLIAEYAAKLRLAGDE